MPPTRTEPLETLLESLGIALGRSSDYEVYGYCPGHEKILGRKDRRPSTWSVARTTGNHHCFSCGYGGTLAELIIELGGANSYWNALTVMKEHGIDPGDPDDLPKTYHERRQLPPPTFLDEEELSGFTDVPTSARRKRRLSRESLDVYGVRWDPEMNMWITPVRLLGGSLLGWQGKNKKIFLNHPPKVPKSTTLFGIDVFEPGSAAILVESPLDVCRLHTAGYDGGVSSMGVVVSDDQMRLMLSLTDEIIFALDNDDNGERWTDRLISGKWIDSKGREHEGTPWGRKFTNAYVLNYEKTTAKDIGEMEDDEIEWAIDHAVPAREWEY